MTIALSTDSLLKKIKDEIVNMQIAQNESIIQFYQAKKYFKVNADPTTIFILYANTAMERVWHSSSEEGNILLNGKR